MIIDGRQIAENIAEELRKKIQKTGKRFTLAVFLVGDDSSSVNFIAQKEKFGKNIGVDVRVTKLLPSLSVQEIRRRISETAQDEGVHGIIVQLPLPKQFSKSDTQKILDAIPPSKDPDMLSSVSIGNFYTGATHLLPPTVAAFERARETHRISLKKGAFAAVVGQGSLIGKPFVCYFMRQEMTVYSCNQYTKNLSEILKISDVVVSGASVPRLIRTRMIKKGAIVVDFGFSLKNGKIAGDVEDGVKKIARYLSPVPGGMGPITVACLFKNLIDMP